MLFPKCILGHVIVAHTVHRCVVWLCRPCEVWWVFSCFQLCVTCRARSHTGPFGRLSGLGSPECRKHRLRLTRWSPPSPRLGVLTLHVPPAPAGRVLDLPFCLLRSVPHPGRWEGGPWGGRGALCCWWKGCKLPLLVISPARCLKNGHPLPLTFGVRVSWALLFIKRPLGSF